MSGVDGAATAAYSRLSRSGPTTTSTRFYQGLGAGPDTVLNWVVSTFVLLYYNRILGLDGFLVSLALGAAVIADAVFDPLLASVGLLGTLVFALVGAVAWLYWQQTKLFTNMNSLVVAFSELVQQQHAPPPPPPMPEAPPDQEDDRASVEEDGQSEKVAAPEVVDGPPGPLDTDTLDAKTKKELHELLTKRGIPFGKADSKTVLVSLLKATA